MVVASAAKEAALAMGMPKTRDFRCRKALIGLTRPRQIYF